MRGWPALLFVCACSKAAPQPSASATPPAPPESLPDDLDVPPAAPLATPSDGGLLVPWVAPQPSWRRHGAPPNAYSLFQIPAGSKVLVYGGMTREACESEAKKRGLPFTPVDDAEGVRAPVRLGGPLHGVSFHSTLPPKLRGKDAGEIMDCRLVLALDDFGAYLTKHDIVDVQVISAYRTPKENGCTNKYAGEQHCAALAADVAQFKKSDGTVLNVEHDYHGKIGAITCQNGARGPRPVTPAASELWEIACDAAGHYFQIVLTPNWNRQHKNHFHLELTTHDFVLVH